MRITDGDATVAAKSLIKVLLFIAEAPESFLSGGIPSDAYCTDRSTTIPDFIRLSGFKKEVSVPRFSTEVFHAATRLE
jgi:hypothetical protein